MFCVVSKTFLPTIKVVTISGFKFKLKVYPKAEFSFLQFLKLPVSKMQNVCEKKESSFLILVAPFHVLSPKDILNKSLNCTHLSFHDFVGQISRQWIFNDRAGPAGRNSCFSLFIFFSCFIAFLGNSKCPINSLTFPQDVGSTGLSGFFGHKY